MELTAGVGFCFWSRYNSLGALGVRPCNTVPVAREVSNTGTAACISAILEEYEDIIGLAFR